MYIIPFNFAQKGKVFNTLNIANLIETAILGGIIWGIVYFTPIPNFYGFLFGVAQVCVFTLLGVNGMSLFTFIKVFIKYRTGSNEFTFPTVEDRVKRNKMIAQKKRQKLKEMEKQEKLDKKREKIEQKAVKKYEKKRRKTGKRAS